MMILNINTKIQLCIIITSPVTKEQGEGSLTSNFKVIRQGHVNYFSIFGFYDLNLVENDTNLITLSHLYIERYLD